MEQPPENFSEPTDEGSIEEYTFLERSREWVSQKATKFAENHSGLIAGAEITLAVSTHIGALLGAAALTGHFTQNELYILGAAAAELMAGTVLVSKFIDNRLDHADERKQVKNQREFDEYNAQSLARWKADMNNNQNKE